MLDPNNALLSQARSGKRLTPIWLVIPLAIVIPILSQMGAIPLVVLNLIRHTPDLVALASKDINALAELALPQTPLEQTLFLISSFGGTYILIWLWLRLVEGRPLTSVGLQKKKAFFKFGRGFGVGTTLFVAVVILGSLPGSYSLEINPVFRGGSMVGVVVVLLGWLIQGSAEELLFRGWVLPVVGARYRLWLGIIISSLMFALAHVFNPNIGLTAILNLLLFGLFTALYALWEESLWGVFSIHAVWNWLQGNIFGLEVSGLALPGESLFITQEGGLDVLTGGAFGPEGGLLATFVLGLSIGLLFWLNRRDRSKSFVV